MSSLISAMIVSSCVGLTGSFKEACQKGIEAGAKQTGLEENVNKAEKRAEFLAHNQAVNLVGNTTIDIVGGTAFLYKTVTEKSIKLDLPTFGLCDNASSQIGDKSYYLNISWRLK